MKLYSDGTNGSIGAQVKVKVNELTATVNRKVASRGARTITALRSAELRVLYGQRNGRRYLVPDTGRTDKKTGKRIRGSGKYYTASAPGEPPARRTGNLRLRWSGDLKTEHTGQNEIKLTAILESDTKYAGFLENGTSKMLPRPFVQKILNEAEPDVEKIFREPYV